MEALQPWYVRHGAKVLGIITAFMCFICGITAMISVSIGCIIGGVLLILIGICVVTLEVPFCCTMVPQLQRIASFSENRSPLQRTIFYALAAVLPLGMCFGVSTIFAALALVGSCVFNVWRFIRDRRAKKAHSEGGGGGVLIGSGSPATISTEPGYPQPSQGVGADASTFHGQPYEKAAVEAVRGVVAGGTGAGYRGAY